MIKRFVLKAALFLSIGFVLAALLAYTANAVRPDSVSNDYADYQLQVRQLQEQTDEIEALSVGNSHSLAIDFETLGQRGYHLWRPSGDLFEAHYQLEALLPSLPNVHTVYISTSYSLFRWDNGADPEREFIRQEMYSILPASAPLPGDLDNFMLGKFRSVFPFDYLIRADHWKNVFRGLLVRPDGPQQADRIRRETDGQTVSTRFAECTLLRDEELAEAAEIDVATYQGRMSTMAAGNTHLQRDTYRTAVELIRLLQERDIRVVFYTPPYYESYVELSDPAMIEEMKQIMSGLQQEYGVEYYDLSADEELISDSRLFLNSDHLNLCGARVFSTRLNELMESHNR